MRTRRKALAALALLVIAGSALYVEGFLERPILMRHGCVGFEKLRYKGHHFNATGTPGIWNIPGDDPENDRESAFELRVQNGAGETLRIKSMDVEYPEGVHTTWSERGYGCDEYNIAGNTSSGCHKQNVSEAEIATFWIEDIGRGNASFAKDPWYRMKVMVYSCCSYDDYYIETAICSGRIEGGTPSLGARFYRWSGLDRWIGVWR